MSTFCAVYRRNTWWFLDLDEFHKPIISANACCLTRRRYVLPFSSNAHFEFSQEVVSCFLPLRSRSWNLSLIYALRQKGVFNHSVHLYHKSNRPYWALLYSAYYSRIIAISTSTGEILKKSEGVRVILNVDEIAFYLKVWDWAYAHTLLISSLFKFKSAMCFIY